MSTVTRISAKHVSDLILAKFEMTLNAKDSVSQLKLTQTKKDLFLLQV